MSTIRANTILDAAGGNTTTINGVTPALSTQAEAEAGANNTKIMTPLRVAQAIAKLASVPNFQSAEQTFTVGTTFTLTHGLGGTPANAQMWLVCKTADAGYAVNDWYGPVGAETFGDGANNGVAMAMNATQIKVKVGAQAVAIPDFSTGLRTILTYANWRIVVRAW